MKGYEQEHYRVIGGNAKTRDQSLKTTLIRAKETQQPTYDKAKVSKQPQCGKAKREINRIKPRGSVPGPKPIIQPNNPMKSNDITQSQEQKQANPIKHGKDRDTLYAYKNSGKSKH